MATAPSRRRPGVNIQTLRYYERADLTTIRAALIEVVDARCDNLTNRTCQDCPIPFRTIGRPDGDTT